MQFLLICGIDENRWEAIPELQRASIMADYGDFVAGLKKDGHYLAGAKLDRSSQAVTVRQRSGKPAIIDGPFAETKEQIGGYHLVECKDREEAISLAIRIPTLGVGGFIEVRSIVSLPYPTDVLQ